MSGVVGNGAGEDVTCELVAMVGGVMVRLKA